MKRETVKFSSDDEWLWAVLFRSVKTKRLLGETTSIGNELLRLAKSQLQGASDGPGFIFSLVNGEYTLNLPRIHLECFEEFLGNRGADGGRQPDEVHERVGEIARYVVQGRFVVIREHSPKPSDDQVEVFCSDKDWVRALEQEWNMLLLVTLKGGENT